MKLLILFVAILPGCLCATIRQSCPLICPEIWSPLCGSDGKTYSNQCKLSAASCHDPSITLAHDGECGTAQTNPPCPAMMCIALYDPVCGTDGKTYSNKCVLHTTHCHGGVTVDYKGACSGDLVVS